MPKADRVSELKRLRARVAKLEEDLFGFRCQACLVRLHYPFDGCWTCTCNGGGAIFCPDCWPTHEKEFHS